MFSLPFRNPHTCAITLFSFYASLPAVFLIYQLTKKNKMDAKEFLAITGAVTLGVIIGVTAAKALNTYVLKMA